MHRSERQRGEERTFFISSTLFFIKAFDREPVTPIQTKRRTPFKSVMLPFLTVDDEIVQFFFTFPSNFFFFFFFFCSFYARSGIKY